MIARRKLLIAFGAGMLASGFAQAQRAVRIYRIGIIQAGRQADVVGLSEEPFLRGLAELGYVEGRNLVVDRRYAEANLDRLPALAAELLALKPDLIFAPPAPATAAVKSLTSTIPIVFCFVNEPVGLGFAKTLARPGGNLTGMSNFSVEIVGKRIELLRQVAPKLKRLVIWYNPEAINDGPERRGAEQAAARFGMEFLAVSMRNPGEIEAAALATRKWGADSVYFTSNPVYYANRVQLMAIASGLKLPAVYWNADFVAAGGLLSYAVDFRDLAFRTASHADKILRGAKPGELPVEQPTQLELVVNMKTAKALGITLPQSILLRADRVIE